MVAELIDKYIWLVQTILDSGSSGLTMEEISRKWERRYGSPYSRRSFNNHREAVAEVFGIEIECRRSDNVYLIPAGKDSVDKDRTRDWLIDNFTVGNLLSTGKERLSGRISVDEIPSGHIYLTSIMSAMLEDRLIVIRYQKYSGDSAETLHIEPYALKEDQRRWYLVGRCLERNALRVYGLDRIVSLEKSDSTFKMPAGFDVDELLSGSFGVYMNDGGETQTIIFRTDTTQAKYIRDLPLHHSQQEMGGDDGSVTFSIRARVNNALVMEFCKLAGKVEVIAPESLRSRLRDIFNQAYKSYK